MNSQNIHAMKFRGKSGVRMMSSAKFYALIPPDIYMSLKYMIRTDCFWEKLPSSASRTKGIVCV
jgi:hypothetical protein